MPSQEIAEAQFNHLNSLAAGLFMVSAQGLLHGSRFEMDWANIPFSESPVPFNRAEVHLRACDKDGYRIINYGIPLAKFSRIPGHRGVLQDYEQYLGLHSGVEAGLSTDFLACESVVPEVKLTHTKKDFGPAMLGLIDNLVIAARKGVFTVGKIAFTSPTIAGLQSKLITFPNRSTPFEFTSDIPRLFERWIISDQDANIIF